MIYTYKCPAPCERTIVVEASDDDEAVDKIMKAGAMACRNEESDNHCGAIRRVMPPLLPKQLREAVRLHMQAGALTTVEAMSL